MKQLAAGRKGAPRVDQTLTDLRYRQASTEPIFRGRKLVLNYTDGSPCDDTSTQLLPRKITNDDDDHDDDDKKDDDNKHRKDSPSKKVTRRKSTLISFICERDSLAPKAHLSFLGASPDECTYFFEARSMAACGGVIQAQQSLGPGGVFGVIALIAAAVYVLGGIAYQRTVMHQRGWRQLPNYNLWAGIFGFVNVSITSLLLPLRAGILTNSLCRTSSRSSHPPALASFLDVEVTTSCPPAAAAAVPVKRRTD